MKKFSLLIMPFVAMSLLASCGGPTTHKFTFVGTNCSINGQKEYSHDIFDSDKNVQYTIVPDSEYVLPETIEGDVSYDNKTGVITISEVKNDITLNVEATPINNYTITFKGEHIDELSITFNHDDFRPIAQTVSVASGYKLTGGYTIEPNEAAEVKLIDIKTIEVMPKINQNITITLLTEKQYYYNATAIGENISYYKDEAMTIPLDRVPAWTYEDFIFYMRTENPISANSEGYLPPTSLDIKAGALSITNYNIVDVGEFPQLTKKVTIPKEAITGDISIHGDGVETDYYHIVFTRLYGLKEPEKRYTYFRHNGEGKIEFAASTSICNDDLLNPEDVYVNFTNEKGEEYWMSPKDDEFKDKGKFEHTSDNKYILTINPNVVDTSVNTIQVIARAKNFHQILDEFTWDEIATISTTTLRDKLFRVGDRKKTNGMDYRIIDFDYDFLANSVDNERARITFECANPLYKHIAWNNKDGDNSTNHDFSTSTLNEALSEGGIVYNLLPKEIMKHIKTVKKVFDLYKDNTWYYELYYPKLFPLSEFEISSYTYYTCGGSRAKDSLYYWLRTVDRRDNNTVRSIDLYGSYTYSYVDISHDVAPAFCI